MSDHVEHADAGKNAVLDVGRRARETNDLANAPSHRGGRRADRWRGGGVVRRNEDSGHRVQALAIIDSHLNDSVPATV